MAYIDGGLGAAGDDDQLTLEGRRDTEQFFEELEGPDDICLGEDQTSIATRPQDGYWLISGEPCNPIDEYAGDWAGFFNVTEEIRQVIRPYLAEAYGVWFDVIQDLVIWVVGLFIDEDDEVAKARARAIKGFHKSLNRVCDISENLRDKAVADWLVKRGYGPLLAFVSQPRWLAFDSPEARKVREWVFQGAPGAAHLRVPYVVQGGRDGDQMQRLGLSSGGSDKIFGGDGSGAPPYAFEPGSLSLRRYNRVVGGLGLEKVLSAFYNGAGKSATIGRDQSFPVAEGIRYSYYNTLGPYAAYYPLAPRLQKQLDQLLGSAAGWVEDGRIADRRNCIEGNLRYAVNIGAFGPRGEWAAGLQNIDRKFRKELAFIDAAAPPPPMAQGASAKPCVWPDCMSLDLGRERHALRSSGYVGLATRLGIPSHRVLGDAQLKAIAAAQRREKMLAAGPPKSNTPLILGAAAAAAGLYWWSRRR